jgi:hypothetical protein
LRSIGMRKTVFDVLSTQQLAEVAIPVARGRCR